MYSMAGLCSDSDSAMWSGIRARLRHKWRALCDSEDGVGGRDRAADIAVFMIRAWRFRNMGLRTPDHGTDGGGAVRGSLREPIGAIAAAEMEDGRGTGQVREA